MKGFRTLSIAIGLALSLVAPVGAAYAAGQRTGNPNPALFPRPAHPYGASMATWGERVGQWIYRQPFPHNPAFDQTGADCAVDQHGPVWFIPPIFVPPGTPRPIVQNASRTCTIPGRKALLLDIGEDVEDFPCPDPAFHPAPGQSLYDFLATIARHVMDTVNLLEVSLDGAPLKDILGYRYHSDDLFLITGDPQPAVVDGFFLMFKPLEPGPHTIVVHGTNTLGDDRTYTYRLTVTPA